MLNPVLFKQLERIFGAGQVHIAKENEPFRPKRIQMEDGTIRWQKIESGEEYRVCCPICGDTRFRLYISHVWGTVKHRIPTRKFVKCFNENCESGENPEQNAVEWLRRRLNPYFSELKMGFQSMGPVAVKDVKEEEIPLPEPLMFPKSEWCIPLTDTRLDGTPVDLYLQSRKFSRKVLQDFWGVVYPIKYPVVARDKNYSWLSGRLFIPCGQGWQAREVGNLSDCKYFSCPGWRKASHVYNLERARKYPLPVVCEGVTDVWRIGEAGLAIFGKAISEKQIALLAENFSSVILMLDQDAFEINPEKPSLVPSGRKSLIKLREKMDVFNLPLPGRKDPGDSTRKFIWDYIESHLSDKAPKCVRSVEERVNA